MLMDEFPTINALINDLRELMQLCTERVLTRRNRTLDRHVFLRKQKPTEL